MPSSKPVNGLPHKTKIYINNQVLLPAKLIKMLGIEWARYADITIKHNDRIITLRRVALLRTRHTASRQFTIPKEIREKYGIMPLDDVEIISIRPIRIKEVDARQLILDE
ncbi:AbrB/MazE/SpoVT family DNA-binding domain-containing protein [Vulcanisaeta distributa]|uniref:SpoVT-AbrB domain-containing protein n=1 Tax=Vulcanisaeta distributa (strain DSM 14429 / JCM 11212 / NBRC 100878 / IC-017) TaxID=572478 RepID=E1QT53_VULDI|nr:AbrB/MazE/SpoVT family DNA-binding domain-containing protein [Vulcanisaeta distributa]ADN49645.1 conserved hypothetical protein [Vulcanisaeta distributa DSM 14429]